MTELDQRKRALQRKRQKAVDRGRPTVFFDKLISAKNELLLITSRLNYWSAKLEAWRKKYGHGPLQ
jgi:hypothetical protein